ncbi:MAG: ribose-phosphate diphosphokinase, partial [Planctomycetes bacterium]|nr:ribose-phosphate diphosphokinase [Planctomycetota bacterium]
MDKKRRLEEINHLKIFSGNANPALARKICEHLSIQLGNAYVGRFPDGEIDLKVNEDVRGADVFLVQPTCPPVNENLTELLIFIDCLKRASAARITAVLPYYGYARKDRKDEGRVPITAKLVANIITEAGADRVLTVDLHAAQIQGFFDIPVDHLLAFPVISKYFERLASADLVVVTPDVGGIKLARNYSKKLGIKMAIVDKRRVGPDETEIGFVIGDVANKNVVMIDDL